MLNLSFSAVSGRGRHPFPSSLPKHCSEIIATDNNIQARNDIFTIFIANERTAQFLKWSKDLNRQFSKDVPVTNKHMNR